MMRRWRRKPNKDEGPKDGKGKQGRRQEMSDSDEDDIASRTGSETMAADLKPDVTQGDDEESSEAREKGTRRSSNERRGGNAGKKCAW